MNKAQIIKEVNQLVGKAQTREALVRLIAFLDSDPKYRNLERIARLAKSKYNRATNNLNAGIIDNTKANLTFNLVSKTILHITDDLETNQLGGKNYEIEGNTIFSRKVISIMTGIFIVMLAALGFWVYQTYLTNNPVLGECPIFEKDSKFNVLLIPFVNEEGIDKGPHINIKSKLGNLAVEHELEMSIETHTNYFEDNDTPAAQEAIAEGRECEADLVIWGVTEDVKDQKIISTNFRYLGDSLFTLKKLELDGKSRLDTVTSYSSIQTEGTITADIEMVISMVFGIAANRTQKYAAAIEVMEQANQKNLELIKTEEEGTELLPNMLLADSYIATNQLEKAVAAYDSVLKHHPNYGFALNNRGVLLYQEEKYIEAIEDFETKLKATPEDSSVHKFKGKAHLKLEQLDKAEEEFRKAQQPPAANDDAENEKENEKATRPLTPSQVRIDKDWETLDSLKEVKRKEQLLATKKIRRNRNDIAALNQRALASQSLGEQELAIRDANKVLRLDKNNPVATGVLIDAYASKKDTAELKKIIEKGDRNNVDWQKVTKGKPTAKTVLKDKRIVQPLRK